VYDLLNSYTLRGFPMRTNIEIDDKLMADVMATGDYKTKREAVEAGLRLVRRRQVYDGLLALQGKLHWDDSDEAWAHSPVEGIARATAPELDNPYAAPAQKSAAKKGKQATARPRAARVRSTSA
jgi:Arc/MetJ family transcription regulator